ncbi:MAG: hypothetical protein E7381_05735 [Clostridiales bacterium]|nr:hypothetical protein [Clostridiales bacterium]
MREVEGRALAKTSLPNKQPQVAQTNAQAFLPTVSAQGKGSRKLFPCGRLRAEPSQKQAFPKATAGCATNAQAFLPTLSANGNSIHHKEVSICGLKIYAKT